MKPIVIFRARALCAIALFLILSPQAAAQGQIWREIAAWTSPPTDSHMEPQRTCASLRELTGYNFSIVSAVMVKASGATPDYCRVVGLIQPEVRFEVALPSQWHGRLLMTGNGGYAGEDLDAPILAKTRDTAVAAGFVYTRTNTGHDTRTEPFGAFASDPHKLLDYGFRAVHVTVETAKRLAASYYGKPPTRSYFLGCSTGGRQGLISAQRFPSDFDGIVAGAPSFSFVNMFISAARLMQAVLRDPVSEDKLRVAGKAIYALCDAKDGLEDGVIDDPRRCGFDPAVHLPRCQNGPAADCFTDAEIRTMHTIYSDLVIGGKRLTPGYPVGAEAEGTVYLPPSGTPSEGHVGWFGWILNNKDQAPSKQRYGEAFFRYFTLEKRPNLRITDVDLEREEPGLDYIRQVLDAVDTDLTAFRDRGGKLLAYAGWADPAPNPLTFVEYFEALSRRMGPTTSDFVRLFMMPGVFHCSGGPGCDLAPRLAAVIDWVEGGKAPDRIVALKEKDGKVVRSRPLCPYPQVARYTGNGSSDEAANFVCSTPDRARN